MANDVLPLVHVAVALDADDDELSATTVLEGLDVDIRGHGVAPLHTDQDPGAPDFAIDLAVARSLRDLHRLLMESVHERVDRTAGDG